MKNHHKADKEGEVNKRISRYVHTQEKYIKVWGHFGLSLHISLRCLTQKGYLDIDCFSNEQSVIRVIKTPVMESKDLTLPVLQLAAPVLLW